MTAGEHCLVFSCPRSLLVASETMLYSIIHSKLENNNTKLFLSAKLNAVGIGRGFRAKEGRRSLNMYIFDVVIKSIIQYYDSHFVCRPYFS